MEDSFKELEYKYNADGVNLVDFQVLVDDIKPECKIDVSSWDIYYTHNTLADHFIRFRMSPQTPEMTKKRKTKEANNWDRIEIDLPLDPNRVNEKTVTAFVGLDGYKENFRIYKSCFISWFEYVNMVWYAVYDENMKEKGRFIEIEINKDKVSELGDRSIEVLKEFEDRLGKLGITHKNRLKKSLFEMYVK
jgi:adenylate cyclase class IV